MDKNQLIVSKFPEFKEVQVEEVKDNIIYLTSTGVKYAVIVDKEHKAYLLTGNEEEVTLHDLCTAEAEMTESEIKELGISFIPTDYEYFIRNMKESGLEDYIYPSFEEAKNSEKPFSLVVIPDEDSNRFEVYLTAIVDDVFGEYTCWVDTEFEEDPNLLYNVTEGIRQIYTSENKRFEMGIRNLFFTSYDRYN